MTTDIEKILVSQGAKSDELDHVLLDILERGMKQIYINHARNKGASEEWLKTLEPLGSTSVAFAVHVIYGDPP